ncbi:Rieske (2Fe-2S) protein [Crocinitomix catalasitica]|uniref:Rieske (2Fe-2S) protein n=1 Tax=Crocinitomix catalasitica TaxID=184607 RepID=UPI000686C30E|nr:Rieske (2Fe-2S) protein [Crocinitomix catalasitica]
MFSTKIKWVKFADTVAELEEQLKKKPLKKVLIDGKSMLLLKEQGDFYLVKNKCPHQGIELTGAVCENGKIVCPWHHYAFDLKTGRGGGLHLENYPIEIRVDGCYAGIEYFSWF